MPYPLTTKTWVHANGRLRTASYGHDDNGKEEDGDEGDK